MPATRRDHEDRSGAEPVDEAAADQRDDETGERARQQVDDAGLQHGRPEAVSRCACGIWTNCVSPRNAKYRPMPTKIGGEVGEHHRPAGQHPIDTSGCFARRSQNHQPTEHDDADRRAAEGRRRCPAPRIALGDRQQHRRQTRSQADRPQPVDRPRRLRGRAGTTNTTIAITTTVNPVVSQKTR